MIVPLYVVELGGGAFVLGLLFASSSFVGVPGALVFGRLADRTGRRRGFVLAAIGATVVTLSTIPLVQTILPVVVANAVLWLGFAAATPVLTLLVVVDVPNESWGARIARLNRFQGVGWTLGLLLGVVVLGVGTSFVDGVVAQRAFFLACVVAAGVGFAVCFRTLPADPDLGEEPSPRRLQRVIRNATRFNVRLAAFPFTPGRIPVREFHPRHLAHRFTPQLALYFGAVFLFFVGFGVFFAPLPAYLSSVGYGSNGIFVLYLVLNVGAAAFYGPAAEFAAEHDATLVQTVGLFARGVTLPAIVPIEAVLGGTLLGVGAMGVSFFVIGLTWAVVAVTAATLITQLSPPAIRGEALGVYGAFVALGGGVGGLLGGWIGVLSYPVTFAIAGVIVLTAAVLVMGVNRRGTGTTG